MRAAAVFLELYTLIGLPVGFMVLRGVDENEEAMFIGAMGEDERWTAVLAIIVWPLIAAALISDYIDRRRP